MSLDHTIIAVGENLHSNFAAPDNTFAHTYIHDYIPMHVWHSDELVEVHM